jgi:hypothetical protein
VTILTARQLNRATLDRQLLLRREPLDAVEAVRRLAALQAQEPASPYLALWNRLAGFDPATLDAAFADRVVVKATLLRITLHAVHADDYPAFHQAMLSSLRAAGLLDRRFTSTGLSTADADALLAPLARFVARPRTRAEIEDWLAGRLGTRESGLWRALRISAPLHYVPTGGPWSFGLPLTLVGVRAGRAKSTVDESVQWLLLRYLQAFGPASAQDFAQFTMLRRPVVQQALTALAGKVELREGPEGAILYDVAGAPVPDGDTTAPPRLLPMWDSVLLAYADRARVIPPDYRALVIRRNGDVLPTLLVDGRVAGVWRPVEGGIEATAFHRLDAAAWQGLAAEAAALVAFLADREPAVYRRYAHWWTKGLPSAEVRVLPG